MTNTVTTTTLQAAARAAHGQLPDHCGFILIVLPVGREDAMAQYVANVQRQDAVKVLKEILFRWGIDEDWMKEAK